MSFVATAKQYFLKKARPHTVYIIPTKRGILFISAAVILVLMGFTYSNNSVLIYGFILASIWLMTKYYTHFNLSKFKVLSCLPQSHFADSPLNFILDYDNQSSLAKNYLEVEIPGKKTFPLYEVLPREKKTAKHAFIFSSRGRYRLKRLKTSTSFPLGLFRSWSYHPISLDFFVYPKAEGFPLPKQDISTSEEDLLESHQKGVGTDDFSQHRDYQMGEPLNRVDWKKFSKNQTRQIKLYESSQKKFYSLDWNRCRQNSLEGKISQLAFWIKQAHKELASWELILPDKHFPMGKGDEHYRICLESLSLYETE